MCLSWTPSDVLFCTSVGNWGLSTGKKFCVACRTHFSYEVAEHGEMSFKHGDVFLVVDTLYGGVVGSWQAMRVVQSSPQDAKKGIIPNLSRYECSSYVLVFICSCSKLARDKCLVLCAFCICQKSRFHGFILNVWCCNLHGIIICCAVYKYISTMRYSTWALYWLLQSVCQYVTMLYCAQNSLS